MDFLRSDIPHLSLLLISLGLGGYLAVGMVVSKRGSSDNESKNSIPIPLLRYVRAGAFFVSIVLLSIALLWPVSPWGNESEREGSEIVWLLDVSRSMDVRDIKRPDWNASRLERAKELMSEFMTAHSENRYGLVIFAGQSRIVSPLTTSTESILTFLSSLDSVSISEGGSNFEKAIELAIERFSATGSTHPTRSFFLLSDGGDPEDAPDETVIRNLFHSRNIRLSTIGFGSEQGGPIPIGADLMGNVLYKKKNGETVVSVFSEQNLRSLSRAGGGKYLSGNDGRTDLSDLVQDITKQVIRSSGNANAQDAGRWLAIMALPFFLASLIPYRKKKK